MEDTFRKFCTLQTRRGDIWIRLGAGRSGDRDLVRVKFSAPVQTCPEAHPASYRMGTGSFPGVKRSGRGVDHPPHPAPR